MSKKHKFFLSPKLVIISLIVLGGLAYSLYRVIPGALQPADIFVISEPFEYGDTQVTGVLSKDASVGEVGNYYLTVDNGRLIMLDVQGMDELLGLTFTVSGFLSPPGSDSELPFMSVTNMESKQ